MMRGEYCQEVDSKNEDIFRDGTCVGFSIEGIRDYLGDGDVLNYELRITDEEVSGDSRWLLWCGSLEAKYKSLQEDKTLPVGEIPK